jgi:trigger factor
MKIDLNRLDNLNARMTIVISQTDYAPILDENMKKYSKKLNIKGFRSGKTPKNVMNKMYGKGILEETVTKLLNDKLFEYLDQNKIAYFGSPVMAEDSEPIDFNPKHPSDYTFVFDLGLKPDFELQYGTDNPLDIKIPSVNAAAIDEDIIRYRRIFGQDEVITEGAAEPTDKVGVSMARLNENNEPEEGAIDYTIDLDRIQGDANEQLPGKKVGDTMDVDLEQFLGLARSVIIKNTLGLPEDPHPEQPLNYRLTIISIHRPQVTELTGEQLTKFVGRPMESEADFRQMLMERDLNQLQGRATDMKKMAIRARLIQANPFGIPEAFLLSWVNRQREKKVEAGTREARGFFRDTSWSLILNKIADEKKLVVGEKDVQKQVTNWVIQNVDYRQVDIQKFMKRLYENEYFMSNMQENALEEVVMQELLPTYQFNETEVSVEDFEKAYHDIHHELFEHDHENDDHGHHHHHHGHEHSHGTHEHSHG